ncbi:hypothetical protein JVU11DRAFT_898 [Chiua virens]|nr:hypothetical protein JVU11DRAFT_898 [Chiua virens]
MTSGLWHKKPSAQGEGVKPPASQDNFKKCWTVGAHMIKQFDEQESEEESEEDSDKDAKPAKCCPTVLSQMIGKGINALGSKTNIDELSRTEMSNAVDVSCEIVMTHDISAASSLEEDP